MGTSDRSHVVFPRVFFELSRHCLKLTTKLTSLWAAVWVVVPLAATPWKRSCGRDRELGTLRLASASHISLSAVAIIDTLGEADVGDDLDGIV